MTGRNLVRELSLAAGPPGAEDDVRRVTRAALDGCGTVSYDRLGSLLCEQPGTADEPRVMLDSHLDEVALMVHSIDADGLLPVVALGGWWPHVLLAQRVDVLTAGGRVPGVIGSTPPHHLSADERNRVLPIESLFVDIGARTRDEARDAGVRVGDPIVPVAEFRELAVADAASGKALDNRLGVALMVETMRALATRDHPNTVVGVGAVQEEVGTRGAGTAAELARPDVAIVLECTPADDLPGRKTRQASIGAGPQIRMFDPTALPNRRLADLVLAVAGEIDVPVQVAVRRAGGTDAATIHRWRAGVPTVVVGVPARYIHSHVGVFRWHDWEAAARLIPSLVERLDRERVANLVHFD